LDNSYKHIRIVREMPVNEKRPRTYRPPAPPENPSAHGQFLLDQFHHAYQTAKQEDIAGFDDRLLLKISTDSGFNPDDLERIPNVELVSQEDNTICLVFATEQALEEFEKRLTTLATGGKPTRAQLLYALKGFDHWTKQDRTGYALKKEGLPKTELFILDIELWAISKSRNQKEILQHSFEKWLDDNQINRIDKISQPSLIMYRVWANNATAEFLLHHRDVRTVDLPPNYGLERTLLASDIADFPEIPSPSDDAPKIAILDSGLMTNHPLLKSAVGDSQDFLSGDNPQDLNGHGTHVAGIALYGDFEAALQSKEFIPELWLLSGRILDENNENNTGFVENHIEKAVKYFHENYGCKIFNLSFGDMRKPYLGGHVRGLAVTLDYLSRELDVLFVVSTGNFEGTENCPSNWREEYPNYLLGDDAAILDPAPALNVLTVGSIARWDRTFASQRYAPGLEDIPVARHDQPSPFTRKGPSIKDAIKPEFVAYGGNRAVNPRASNQFTDRGLGEISTNSEFAEGRLVSEKSGTSFATPHLTHFAGKLLINYPNAGVNLIRALLVSNARQPVACTELFNNKKISLRNITGYGQVIEDTLFRSTEDQVTMFAEEKIIDKHHHFYEIPVPEDFYSKGRRVREITVSLAYCPSVRTTRIDYKSTRINFKLVEAIDIKDVLATFNAATTKEEYVRIPEVSSGSVGFQDRSNGTVQSSTWKLKIVSPQRREKKLFVVVTRNDFNWGKNILKDKESYALVITLRDQEGENVRLYNQIQNILRLKQRITT